MNALLRNTIIAISVISFIFLIKFFFYPTQSIEKNHIKIVLSGPPKSGKTTLLKKLIQKLSESDQNIYGCLVQEILDKNQKRIGFKNIFLPESREIILASKKTTYSDIFVGSNNVNVKGIKNSLIPFIKTMTEQPQNTLLIFDEIGRIQNSYAKSISRIKQIFELPHTLISTVVYDDEIWARPFKDDRKYFQIVVNSNNREKIIDLLLFLLQKKEYLQSMPPQQFQTLIENFNLEIQHSIENAKVLFH